MRAVVLTLIAVVLEDHESHRNHHESAEDEHRGRHREIELDQERVDAEHRENRKIFVEILHGNGASRAHKYVTAVLQKRVHRYHEEAGTNAYGHHRYGGDDRCPGELEPEHRKAAFRGHAAVEVGHARDENPHEDSHRQDGERLLKRYLSGGEYGADGNSDAHDGLHDGALREVHAERMVAPLENEELQHGARPPKERRHRKRNLSETVVPEQNAALKESADRVDGVEALLGVACSRVRDGEVHE